MTTSSPDPDATARAESGSYTPLPRGPQAQFAPGTMIAGRYRIAGILGSGGMGEVYRADDIKLDQTVALKFLPARLARDPVLLARLHDEVRLGRQVAHPNVCRIYDIVDWQGAHFVAMEFVDGEDLSRLLRRIGRLAEDKAVDIARGITAGLAAAHAKGILHRDLKPANVMIDSRGDSRIMDFALALGTGEDDGTISGTPAYMAPEQLAGQPASVQSDLYALGLVMYELFTGKRAHAGRTMPERVRELGSEITTPSSVVRGLDPAVERIILRCLDSDPSQRPRSAREVIESLPGGDPLAAAMAAGETPSPRIVAAAGTEGTLRPAVAWALLGGIVALLAAVLLLHRPIGLMRLSGVTRAPAAMADRAETILRELGLPTAQFRAGGYRAEMRYLAWIFANEKGVDRWNRLGGGVPAVVFWLREGAEPSIDYEGRLTPTPTSPPLAETGEKSIQLDPRGRLVQLAAVPDESWKPRPLDWKPLLNAAGLGGAALERAEPRLLPPFFADARAAWTTKHPDDGTPLRIEAAAWRGTPVFFRIVAPWDEAEDARSRVPFGAGFHSAVLVLFLLILAGGTFLAWRNIRLRRGDRQGAFRLAATIALLYGLGVILDVEHQLSAMHELELAVVTVSLALLTGAVYWLLYIAIEPFMRRRLPDRLISWSRLLAGNWRDPMVGRDVLIGLAGGVLHAFFAVLASRVVMRMPTDESVDEIESGWAVVSHILTSITSGPSVGFAMMSLLVVYTLLLRRRSLAFVALWATQFGLYLFASTEPGMIAFFVVISLIYAAIPARFGLLAATAMHFGFVVTFFFPHADAVAWYTATALVVPLFVVALAIWAFRTSLGGQSALGFVDQA